MSTWAELLLVSTCVAKWIQNMQMHLGTQLKWLLGVKKKGGGGLVVF